MGKTVAELEAQMGASEFEEWTEFWKVEPFGPLRDNIHAGLIAATLANANRKKNSAPVTFEDFLLVDPAEHKRRQTRKTLAWMRSVGKKVKRGN